MVLGVKMRRLRGVGLVLMCVALASGCASAHQAAQPASQGEVVLVASPSPRPRLISARAIPKAPLRLANPLHQDVLDALRASPDERGYSAIIEALACAGAIDQAQQVRTLALEQLGAKARLPWARTACVPRATRALVGRVDDALTLHGIDAVMAPKPRGEKLIQLAEEAHARGDVAVRDHALDQLGRLWRAQPGGVGIELGLGALWAEWRFGLLTRANATGRALLARPRLPEQDCHVRSSLCASEGMDETLRVSACEWLIQSHNLGGKCLKWVSSDLVSALVHHLMRAGDAQGALRFVEFGMNKNEGGALVLVDAAIAAQRYELALQAIALFYRDGIERQEMEGFRARVRLLEAAYKSRHPQHAAWEQEVVNDLNKLRGGNVFDSYRVEATCVLAEHYEATGRPKLASARWRMQPMSGFSLAISLARAGRLSQAQQVVQRSLPSLREELRGGDERGGAAMTLKKLIFRLKTLGSPELMATLMAGLERGEDYGYARVALLSWLYDGFTFESKQMRRFLFEIEPQQMRRFLKYTLAEAPSKDRARAYERVAYVAIARGMVDVLKGISPKQTPAQLRELAIKLAAINLPEAMRWMTQLQDSDMSHDALMAMLTSLHENKGAEASQREALLQEGLLQYHAVLAFGPQRNALWRALIRALLVEGRCDEAHALSRERPPNADVPELDSQQLQACGRAGHVEAARGLARLIEDPEARRAALVMLLQ